MEFYLSPYHNRVTLTLLCWLETLDSPTFSAATDLEATLQLQSILSTTHRRDITTQCDGSVDCDGSVIQKYCGVPFVCLQTSHKSVGRTFWWLLWHTPLGQELFLRRSSSSTSSITLGLLIISDLLRPHNAINSFPFPRSDNALGPSSVLSVSPGGFLLVKCKAIQTGRSWLMTEESPGEWKTTREAVDPSQQWSGRKEGDSRGQSRLQPNSLWRVSCTPGFHKAKPLWTIVWENATGAPERCHCGLGVTAISPLVSDQTHVGHEGALMLMPLAREHELEAQRSQQSTYNKPVRLCEFHPSERVFLRIPCANSNFLASWQGVYAVPNSTIGANSYNSENTGCFLLLGFKYVFNSNFMSWTFYFFNNEINKGLIPFSPSACTFRLSAPCTLAILGPPDRIRQITFHLPAAHEYFSSTSLQVLWLLYVVIGPKCNLR